MKKKINILALFLFILPFLSIAQNDYYYYKGEKIYLTIDKEKLNIITFSDFQSSSISNLNFNAFSLKNDSKIIDGETLKFAELEFQTTPSETTFYQTVNALKNNPKIRNVAFFYKRTNAEPIGTSNIFYVKLKSGNDYNLLEQVASDKNVVILHQNKFMPLWYKLGLNRNTIGTSIDMTNEFYETGHFSDIDPAFMFHFRNNCANDSDFNQLWGLYNSSNPDIDINACDAWSISEGSGVNVAIVDHGVFKEHNDLNDNISSMSYDSETGTSPSVTYPQLNHGTHIAGTIAAEKDNDLQVVGVAPQSNIISISNKMWPYSQPYLSEELADGINWAWEDGLADVINNSWGDHAGLYYDELYSQVLNYAISNAITNGRDGLGTLVVFSSGNNGNIGMDYPGNSNPSIITVGAIDQNGNRSLWPEHNQESAYGISLDLVAPGTDILSTWAPQATYSWEGTSMAAPHVVGVVALILSVNPCLNGEQVRDIIENTAQKVGDYNYENTSERPNGTWNEEMGYGLVDAYAAVQLAQDLNSPTLDLLVKDSPDEMGVEPNTVTEHMWSSKDIWVRNTNDNGLEHQNPEYKSNGEPNYIYVRIINKSCVASNGNETITINWAKANTALAWPEYWDGTLTDTDGDPLGGELPFIATIPVFQPGQEAIIELPWVVPNPEDYSDNPNPWHFCLLSRIDATDDPLTSPMTPNPNIMVRENNNLAWKNLTVVDLEDETSAMVMVANPSNISRTYFLELQKETNEVGKAVFEEAEVTIKMDDVLFNAWERGGKQAQLLDPMNDEKKKLVKGNNVILDNIMFDPNEMGLLTLDFNFLIEEITDKTEYVYHVIQKDINTGEVIGGETFVIRKEPRPIFDADAGEDKEIDKNESITINAEQINEAAIYNWYDVEGNLIYTGKDLTVSPDVTKKYKLEIIADSDGFKDFDEVEVKVNPYSLETIVPNPASNQVTISYKAQDASSAYLMVLGTNNGTSNNYILDTTELETTIDITSYQLGFYTVALVCDGEIVDAKTLIKE